jgi:hypothetical protein
MNPKSSGGSIYIKSSGSGSGSAASSFVAPSDTAEAVTSGSKSPIKLDPLQQTLVETFNISPQLMQREKVVDLRVAYSKFLDIQRVIEGVNQMELAQTWTWKKPTIQDIVEIYMSRSGYFHRHHKFFPKVSVIPGMEGWLRNEEGALEKKEVWGDKQPSFKNLSDMLDLYGSPGKKKKVTKGKRKQVEPSSHSEEEVVKGKGKGKAKSKKAGGDGKKKAGPSKSRQNDD